MVRNLLSGLLNRGSLSLSINTLLPLLRHIIIVPKLLPHIKSLEDDTVEEERRLFYVAITRAKKKLYITYANYRRYMETIEPTIMSRFISEIDTELLDIDTEKKIFNKKKRKQINIVLESEKLYRIGQKISHPQFGIGTVK